MTPFTSAESAAADALIQLALAEDFGTTGDRTSLALIPSEQRGQAVVVARVAGVLAGNTVAERVCSHIHPTLHYQPLLSDGSALHSRSRIALVTGQFRDILAAERTLLNFLQRLSGIASLTRQYVHAVHGTRAVVLDTRKTTPGWRLLEKYAVRMGGGTNHRIGLYDGILIKDNHIAGLTPPDTALVQAVQRARAYPGNAQLAVEIEVDTLDQLTQVLPTQPEIVLLDNMPPELLREAVQLRNMLSPQTQLEASGGVNLTTIRPIAETGVDRISVGAITHSATALDIGLDYEAEMTSAGAAGD